VSPVDIIISMGNVLKGLESGEIKTILTVLYVLVITIGILKPNILNRIRGKNRIYTSDEYNTIVTNKITQTLRIREESAFKIYKLEFSIMRDQMAYAENTMERSKNEQLKSYSRALHDKIENKPLTCELGVATCYATSQRVSSNLQLYDNLLDIIFKEILSETRRACRDNGFDLMSDAEYEHYINQITEVCMSKGEILMRQHYNTHVMILTYEEGKDTVNQDVIARQTADVFRHARQVTLRVKKRIEDAESEYIENLEEMLGPDG
jgi:hypothetical protein